MGGTMDEDQNTFYDDDDSEEEARPSFLKVVLRETDDVVLYECTSTTVPTDSEDAAGVLEDNAKYEYLTVGKGRHRPTLDAEVTKSLFLLGYNRKNSRRMIFWIGFRLKPL